MHCSPLCQRCCFILSFKKVIPPTFTMKLEPSVLLKTGQPLKLSCKVQGTPVINITWFKNGSKIASDHRHTMSFDSSIATLELENCSVEDSGDYVCMGSSQAGQDQCSSSVTVKGWFRSFAYLQCLVSGSLPMAIQWYKDGKKIHTEEKHKCTFFENVAFLEISCLNTYNEAGTESCTVELEVKGWFFFTRLHLVSVSVKVKIKENIIY
uniref:Ig-like domain-containing protein n=1 Tax=Dicentrarchus labrax TaxID=13489 RepID=A0A8P4G7Z7_DICLA